ncbi:1,2-phenylacetyl-CoA epoxidase subunit PaaD [Paraflavisolibacter sp. H34]|uniref:1,2-phenylacetyl-CoA epoxidase subunit PaaD n=1 Tax=Huijunlia imazamoxiresistens TaxID=3127457 RepID=UPI0030177A66
MANAAEERNIWRLLQAVTDPEIPVLSITDLGIVREVKFLPDTGEAVLTLTPTYSGCPAMEAIRLDIRLKLLEHGYPNVTIHEVLSPAWTTDWMSEEGKRKLHAYGIAPPNPRQQFCNLKEFFEEEGVACPRCGSYDTKLVSRFGSTACKALYQCRQCGEAFDYFKCH